MSPTGNLILCFTVVAVCLCVNLSVVPATSLPTCSQVGPAPPLPHLHQGCQKGKMNLSYVSGSKTWEVQQGMHSMSFFALDCSETSVEKPCSQPLSAALGDHRSLFQHLPRDLWPFLPFCFPFFGLNSRLPNSRCLSRFAALSPTAFLVSSVAFEQQSSFTTRLSPEALAWPRVCLI